MKKAILVGLSILSVCLYLSCNKEDDSPQETKEVEITGFSPASGEVGTEITINGKNFSATKTENSVTFNGTSATVKSATATSLKVDVPNGATTGKIKVTVGSSSATGATDFEVIPPQADPLITGFSSTVVCREDGVTVEGENFGSNIENVLVYIGETLATIFSVEATAIEIQVPAGATSGLVEVKVKVGDLSAVSENELEISPSPAIDSFDPVEGEWGTEITIIGTNFNMQGNEVIFQTKNGIVVGEILSESATQIVVTVPDGAKTAEIGVYNGECFVQSNAKFTVFPGRWKQIADFGGGKRRSATTFVLDGVPYVGLGTDGTVNPNVDLWSYDPNTNQWVEKSSIFPGNGHLGCSSFVVGSTAYVTQGLLTGMGSIHQEMWEYNAGTDQWTVNNSFANDTEGLTRYVATAFSIDGKGYMGTGYGTGGVELNDFWEYDNGTWTQKTNVGGNQGPVRYNAVGVALNGKGYVGTGYDLGEESVLNDFWEYDPANDTWTQKADMTMGRASAVSFAVGGKIYVGLGVDIQSNKLDDFWEYNPETNVWSKIASFPEARSGAVAFVLNGKAYVGTGYGDDELSDFWELDLGN